MSSSTCLKQSWGKREGYEGMFYRGVKEDIKGNGVQKGNRDVHVLYHLSGHTICFCMYAMCTCSHMCQSACVCIAVVFVCGPLHLPLRVCNCAWSMLAVVPGYNGPSWQPAGSLTSDRKQCIFISLPHSHTPTHTHKPIGSLWCSCHRAVWTISQGHSLHL